jgi:hypothetical protein
VGPVEEKVWRALVGLCSPFTADSYDGWRSASVIVKATRLPRREVVHHLERFLADERIEAREFAYVSEPTYRPVVPAAHYRARRRAWLRSDEEEAAQLRALADPD